MTTEKSTPQFFAWFPWEKITIWSFFLFLVYILRDFFAVIFLTFIFSYIATNIVRKIMQAFWPNQQRSWLYKLWVIIVYLVFLLLLSGIIAFLRKPFEQQIRDVRHAISGLNPATLVDDLLQDTLGKWRYEEQYEGETGEARFRQDFQLFKDKNPALLKELSTDEEGLKNQFRIQRHRDFAYSTLTEWEFIEIENVKQQVAGLLPKIATALGQAGIYIFQFTIWFALSLLLSFFITFDLPRMKRGVQKISVSRIRHLYEEIAPSLAAFGLLIGRAFQAQAVIAVCNTILTWFLIRLLDIPYELFLCTIVFLCSFVPVLGVWFSTVPIALIGLLHHGIGTALLAVLGVTVIHLIETSILNPKIVGEMLHIHPVLVLTVLVIGEYFFGVWGLLLGVPILVYLVRYVILGEVTLPPLVFDADLTEDSLK